MNAAVLIDTNVLVYAYDTDETLKCAAARQTLDRVARSGCGSVSAQVLGELYTVLVRRFSHRMPREMASEHVRDWNRTLMTYDTSAAVVLEALRGVARHKMPYFDAQIWAVARLNRIPLVLSEDFTHGRVVEGVRFADPFSPGFDLDAALAV